MARVASFASGCRWRCRCTCGRGLAGKAGIRIGVNQGPLGGTRSQKFLEMVHQRLPLWKGVEEWHKLRLHRLLLQARQLG